MPQIQRHPGIEAWVLDAARAHLTRRPRTGIHVSDLTTPRKAYWSRILPKELSNRDVLYFIAGRGHEDVLVALAGLKQYHKVRGEWLGTPDDPYAEGDGVRYEIDVVTPTQDGDETPIEFKTNRRATVIDASQVEEQYGHYLAQLGRYCSIVNRLTSYLLVLHLMARNLSLVDEAQDGEEVDDTVAPNEVSPFAWIKRSEPVLVTYQVDWTPQELETIRQEMAVGRRLLEAAIEAQDHTSLPECPPWMCGREVSRAADPVCSQCGTVYKVGEAKDDGTKQGVLKLCKICKGSDKKRVALTRDVTTVFVPSCPYWSFCLPSQWKQHHSDYFRPVRAEEDTDV